MKCNQLLKNAAEQYKGMADEMEALKRGEITAEEFNNRALACLSAVDGEIEKYRNSRQNKRPNMEAVEQAGENIDKILRAEAKRSRHSPE